jgi:hypothetical protein
VAVASAFGEHELELPELELGEHELELEGELESPEAFGWSDITSAARRGWNTVTEPGSWQRRAALAAARAAVKGGSSLIGTRLIGGDAGKTFSDVVGSGLAGILPDKELELYGESAFHELENELSPVRRIYPDAIMEHMAHEATEAENEQEAAEGFLPLIPMLAAKVLPLAAKVLPKIAGKVLPKIGQMVSKVAPRLIRGVSNITRTLFRNRQTRPLIRTVPTIARRTISTIARQTAAGRPVSPIVAQRVLAQQAARCLASPQQVAAVMRRANTLDRCYHRITSTPMPPPIAVQRVAVQARRTACHACGRVA